MKKNRTFFIILISVITFCAFFYNFRCYRKLPEITNFKIFSETGMPIPAKLYKREVESKINGKTLTIKEIIVCFDDVIIDNVSNTSNKQKVSKFIVVIPDLKMIGLINKPDSFEIKDDHLCQTDKIADTFTSMINNNVFFSKPPINEAQFSKDRIVFNTYGVLKKFGNKIIISDITNRGNVSN